eukprot:s850_g10.t1
MVGELLRRRRRRQRLPLRVIQHRVWLHAVAGSVRLQVVAENMLGPGTGIAAACVRWALTLRDVRRTLQSFHAGLAVLCGVSRGALVLLAVRRRARETRKRASEIVELRKQNEQKFSAKEHFYKQKWESIRQAQATNAQQREKAKAVREQTRHSLMEQKHVNASSTKQQSQQMLLQKKEREAAERQANLER